MNEDVRREIMGILKNRALDDVLVKACGIY